MEIKGTKEAFFKLISLRGIYTALGVERSTVANWKKYLNEGKVVSIDKMEEMLLKYGAVVKRDKVWEINQYDFGKNIFTKTEETEILKLLVEKEAANSEAVKKSIRHKLRNDFMFNIILFDQSRQGYGPSDFNEDVKNGNLIIIDDLIEGVANFLNASGYATTYHSVNISESLGNFITFAQTYKDGTKSSFSCDLQDMNQAFRGGYLRSYLNGLIVL